MKSNKSLGSAVSLASESTALDFSRSQDFVETKPSTFGALCSFSQTLKKPKWMVKFPLVIPEVGSPRKPLRKEKTHLCTLHSIREARPTDECGSRPWSTNRQLNAIEPPTTRRHLLRQKSAELLARLESDCEALRRREERVVSLQTRQVKRLRKRLAACEKHTRLISYSNENAAYFLLLHKFASKHKSPYTGV